MNPTDAAITSFASLEFVLVVGGLSCADRAGGKTVEQKRSQAQWAMNWDRLVADIINAISALSKPWSALKRPSVVAYMLGILNACMHAL